MGLLDRLLDASIVASFDASGFRRHARRFDSEPGSMEGRRVLITGASSGLGLATARALAGLGAEVWGLARSEYKLEALREEIGLHPLVCDLADLGAVRALELPKRLDVLVHNAGVLLTEPGRSPQGHELTLAVNLLGPELLTRRLLPALTGGRVILVSSGGMYSERLDPGKLVEPPRFDGVAQYARTKRAQVVLARLWAQRHPELRFASMHPGWADTPGVVSSLPRFHRLTRAILRTPEQGCDTVVWLAAGPEWPSGRFWFDRQPVAEHLRPGTRVEEAEEQRLWQLVERVVGPSG